MRRHVTLEDEEFPAIAVAMPLHVLVGDCASFCVGRTSFEEVAGGIRSFRAERPDRVATGSLCHGHLALA